MSWLTALLGLLAVAAPAATSREAVAADARAALERYRRDGDHAAAKSSLRALVAAAPSSPAPRCALAAVLLDRDEWVEARAALEACAAAASGTRGATLAWLEIERVDRLLAASPDERRRIRYGELLAEARAAATAPDPVALTAVARRAAEVDPGRWEVAALAGAALGRAGRWAECAEVLERASATVPQSDRPLLVSGARQCREEREHARFMEEWRVAEEQGDFRKAGAAAYAAWKLMPDRLACAFPGALALARAGDDARALELLRAVADGGPARDRAKAAAILQTWDAGRGGPASPPR